MNRNKRYAENPEYRAQVRARRNERYRTDEKFRIACIEGGRKARGDVGKPHGWECARDTLISAKVKRRAIFLLAVQSGLPRLRAARRAGISERTARRYLSGAHAS